MTRRATRGDWLLLGLLAVAFAPAVVALKGVWDAFDYYSHGYLVPLVSAWIAWSARHRLAEQVARRDARGLALLGASLGAYALGLGVGDPSLEGVALVGAVAGAVLFLRGSAWLRVLAFPVGFLLFMVPVPAPWLAPVIVQLRLFVTSAAVAILHGLAIPVARDGNVIELAGGGALFVADACSGVTSIVTLAPLGVLFAWYTERGWGRRAILVASVVPIAMLGNLLRVVGTTVAAQRVGVEAATNASIHESAGLLTYVLGCLALVALGALLRRIPSRPPPHTPSEA